MKCFWKAHCVGDIEGGIALYQLATMYEKVNDVEQAAAAYNQYILDAERQGITERDQQSRAYKFLAHFFLKKGKLIQSTLHVVNTICSSMLFIIWRKQLL